MKFDLSLMDVDGRRLKRRKKWLLFSLLPLVVALCVTVKLIMPGVATSFLKSAYGGKDYEAARFWSQINLFINVLEPYVAYYNDGTVLYGLAQYEVAEEQFNAALLHGPPESRRCEVRVNLSLSIEAQADAMRVSKEYDEAIVMYDRAKAALYGDNCVDPVKDEGKLPEAIESRRRIDEKVAEVVRLRNDDQLEEDTSDPGSQGQDDQPASQSQKQELQDRMKDALQYRQSGRAYRRGMDSKEGNAYEPGRRVW